MSLYSGMPRRRQTMEDLWAQHLINASEAARVVTLAHESTIRRWFKNAKTSFGMALDVSVKENHLVISHLQALSLRKELQRRDDEKFERLADELDAELKSGVPLSPRKPKYKYKSPQP